MELKEKRCISPVESMQEPRGGLQFLCVSAPLREEKKAPRNSAGQAPAIHLLVRLYELVIVSGAGLVGLS
jgi:hypothetical protein